MPAPFPTRSRLVVALALTLTAAWPLSCSGKSQTDSQSLEAFDDAIAAFEQADLRSPPPPDPIVFVGSSSIRMWSSLETDMHPMPVLNRGFGGSQMTHVIRHVDRIVTRYEPSAVVVYEGDNDLVARTGKTPEIVAASYRQLVSLIHEAQPEVPIYFVSIKPSPSRWDRWPQMSSANSLIRAFCEGDDRLHYLDVATPMLDESGKPRPEIFLADDLHMNAAGYTEWKKVIRPALEDQLRSKRQAGRRANSE